MKRLFALLRKMRAKISVNTNKHPMLMTLLMFVCINLAILFVTAGVLMLIYPSQYGNYFRAFLKVGEWLMFPSSILPLVHSGEIVLGLIVAITGMILFSGTIIALATNYLRTYINQKTEGRGKLPLSGHIVILNYNSQVLAILTDLMHDKRDETIIILSDKTKDYIRDELAAEIEASGEKPEFKLDLIVRKGNPFSVAELNDINIEKAKSIMIMDDENSKRSPDGMSVADYDTIKLVLALAKFKTAASCPIAVEAESFKTVEIIRSLNKTVPGLKKKKIEVFSYHRKLGQFLALTAICPEMSSVLYSLLSYNGCMLYPTERTSVENYLETNCGGIPIISLDKTYVLAKNAAILKQKRDKPYKPVQKIEVRENLLEPPALNLYIIGDNKKRQYLIETLEAEESNIKINLYKSTQREKFLSDLENAPTNSTALILSEDGDVDEIRDENVFLTLVEINQKFGVENRPFKIIAEILEPKNQESVEQLNIQNIIVSSRIISFFATKLILDANSDKFYEDVFTHSFNGSDSKFSLWIDEVGRLFNDTQNLKFHSYTELINTVYYGSNKKIMPLGIVRKGKNIFFCNDMDKKRTLTIQESDHLIYVRYK